MIFVQANPSGNPRGQHRDEVFCIEDYRRVGMPKREVSHRPVTLSRVLARPTMQLFELKLW